MNDTQGFTTELYFITTTVVDWIDIFTRPKYKRIVTDSLEFCQRNKGLKIYAWVLMTNHLHFIASTDGNHSMAEIMRDFKEHTSKTIYKELLTDINESRQKWMLNIFEYNGFHVTGNRQKQKYKIWQKGYYVENICTTAFYKQKLSYIHANPVRQEFVIRPEDYPYSSAIDYAGGKGIIDVEVLNIS